MMTEAQLAMIGIAAVAAVTDWRTGQIPNWLTLPVVAGAPAVYYVAYGPAGAVASALGILACGIVPYLMFRRDAIGGGDVKLFAALGAVGGVQLGLEAELLGLGAASLLALAMMAWRGALGRTLRTAARVAANPVLPRRLRADVPAELMTSMRLGTPVLIGTIAAVLVAGVR